MKGIVIIHFSPLELYPPVQNLIHALKETAKTIPVTIITSRLPHEQLNVFDPGQQIRIIRLASSKKQSGIVRYVNYLRFYTASIFYLFLLQPVSVFYYETLSSFPALIYHFVFKRTHLYVHYHEYTSSEEYKSGMMLNRFFHALEKKQLGRAAWVSHTNDYRLQLFKTDIRPVQFTRLQVLPNYPPESWRTPPRSGEILYPARVVYVGALSMHTMYVREFAQWIIAQNGKLIWDIYTYNFSQDTYQYIQELNCSWIHVKKGVDYQKLPFLLKNYDVGVILYKGHIPNYVFNAPNKLFEYLATGLDVWFPSVMTGSQPLVTAGTYPKVISLDFERLKEYDINKLLSREGSKKQESAYFAESVLEPIVQELQSNG